MRKRITFIVEELNDDDTVGRSMVQITDGHTESLPHVLKAFLVFLREMTFVVDIVGAQGPSGTTRTSDDV